MSQPEDDAKMVEEMERLEREASAGPWKDCGTIDQDASPWGEVIGLNEIGSSWHYDHELSIKDSDRALIVTARNNFPRLLALAKIGVLAVAWRPIKHFRQQQKAAAALEAAIDAYKEKHK
jgi:hypothetical protein